MDKINVDLYGGKGLFGGRETPLEAEEIYCDHYQDCGYFRDNKCLNCRSLLGARCKFGKINTTKGYTSRAAKYYDFKRKYTADPAYNKLDYPKELVAKIGDVLFVNIKYVNVRKRTDRDEKWMRDVNGYIIGDPGFGGCWNFFPIEDLTNELLHAIFSYSPRAMMGGAISDYSEKVVPEILQGMKREIPEIYFRFISEYPQYDMEPNYLGKTAYIDSLKPGTTFDTKNGTWIYDGQFVSSVGEVNIGLGSPWWAQNGSTATEIKIKVNPKMTFEITNNAIVDENTRFS